MIIAIFSHQSVLACFGYFLCILYLGLPGCICLTFSLYFPALAASGVCEDAGGDPCQVAIAEVHQREPEWSEDTEKSISQALTKMGFHGNCSSTLLYPAKLREPKIVVKSGQNHVSNGAFLRLICSSQIAFSTQKLQK